jgi:hypothetical protein
MNAINEMFHNNTPTHPSASAKQAI